MQGKKTHKEIVMKLVGEVRPVGESNEDTARFENLKQLCDLTNQLLYEISMVELDFKDRYEFSLRRASEYAREWMDETLGGEKEIKENLPFIQNRLTSRENYNGESKGYFKS